MSIFDGGKSEQIKFLEDERKKLWDRVIKLEGDFKDVKKEAFSRSSDSEKEAKEHSRRASEFRNKVEGRLDESIDLVSKIRTQLESAENLIQEIGESTLYIKREKFEVEFTIGRLDEAENLLNSKINLVNKKIESIDKILEKYPDLDDQISKIEEFISKVEENNLKSETTLTETIKKKKEIDNIHRTIFGYSHKDDTSNVITKVEGLKDELEQSYNSLKNNLEDAEGRILEMSKVYKGKFDEFESKHKDKYSSILSEIRGLLPNAMTAGLSSAFSKKKEDEVTSSIELQRKFTVGIYFLILISLIPLAISIYFLSTNVELLEVINRIPRLVLSIVPMYIPALWFTISASKKLNLSKRLIEEYSHKEVLSKTYEGLTNQISNIQDKQQSEELKFRLLTNFLQVTSENPGKLISNYETSDHPVMEALEQSYKFQVAIDKLESIPGMGKVAAILEKKAKRRLEDRSKKIEDGLSPNESE